MIYVFKSSFRTKGEVKNRIPRIHQILPKAKWNVDPEDCDRMLHIESDEIIVSDFRDLLTMHWFYFEEWE